MKYQKSSAPHTPSYFYTELNYLLFFVLCAGIHTNIGPWQFFGPPRGPRRLTAPTGFAATSWILQHQRNECAQLRLCHLFNRCWNTIDDQRRQFEQRWVLLNRWRCLLGQCRFKFLHDNAFEIANNVFQRFGTEYFVTGVWFARGGHQYDGLLTDTGCEFVYGLL